MQIFLLVIFLTIKITYIHNQSQNYPNLPTEYESRGTLMRALLNIY